VIENIVPTYLVLLQRNLIIVYSVGDVVVGNTTFLWF